MRAGVFFLPYSVTKCPLWKQEVAAHGPVGLSRCWKRYVCSSLQGVVTWLTRLLKSG